MKNLKVLALLFMLTGNMHAHIVQGSNNSSQNIAIDFLDVAGNSHANMVLAPGKTDERDIGGWCTEKIRITVIKPNGGYGGAVEEETNTNTACISFAILVGNSNIKIIGGSTRERLEEKLEKLKKSQLSNYGYINYSMSDLLKVTTENSIIANKTTAQITLFNAPSLGSGASDGVPVNPGGTIPFYLNAGSAGEELVIKGNGAGTVSFGNDYAAHKTTWIGSTNISKFQVINGDGAVINKGLNAQAQLVIDPLERLDITTPAADWEIRLKVAEKL